MIETLTQWLTFLGWGPANLIAIAYGCALATVAAWVTKYPLRLFADRNGYPLAAFKWAVRTISGLGALVGTGIAWPGEGRHAWLAGVVAWVVVTLIYRYSAPIIARFFPWVSTDNMVKDDDA